MPLCECVRARALLISCGVDADIEKKTENRTVRGQGRKVGCMKTSVFLECADERKRERVV